MDLQSNAAIQAVQASPPPAEADGRATADAAAIAKDATPEVPLPIPAAQNQAGLVSRAARPDKDAAPKLDTTGASAVQRTLKPYGINMLPEKTDAPERQPEDAPEAAERSDTD